MIEYINIEKYKCFENFELKGLSRINIISGENNVGKTALLEMLYISDSNIDQSLSVIANNRNIKEKYFSKYLKDTILDGSTNYAKFTWKVKNKNDLSDEENEEKNKFNADYDEFSCLCLNNKLYLNPLNMIKMEDDVEYRYINSSKPSNQRLIKLYSKIQTLNLQHKLLEYLQLLDSNIKWIEPQLVNDELVLRVNLHTPEISLITSELGEGVNRYIEILASALFAKKSIIGKSIFIDELENGLHYSKLLNIAKSIINISKNEEIQIFITTHDRDTIEAFAKASQELEFKEISSIRLFKDEDNKIQPIVHQYDTFAYGIETGMDLR